MAAVRWYGFAALIGILLVLGAGCASPAPSDALGPDDRRQLRQVLTALVDPPPPEAVEDYRRRQEDLLVRCMREAGFSYVPWHRPQPPQTALGLPADVFARRYGFGLSTLIDLRQPGRPVVDPNRAAVRALPPERRGDYRAGEQRCRRAAQDQLGLPPMREGGEMETSRAVGDRLREISRNAERDARLVSATQAYRRCVADRGHPAAGPGELVTDFRERAAPYSAAYYRRALALVDTGRDSVVPTMSDVLDAPRLAELRVLQKEEIAAAVADQPCSAVLDGTVRAVHREYEQRALRALSAD